MVDGVAGLNAPHDWREFFYYSLLVLVTGSQGDITPNTLKLRVIASAESLTGLLILAVVVALAVLPPDHP